MANKTGGGPDGESDGTSGQGDPAPKILMPSIVDFAVEYNGASAVTRSLTNLLALPPLDADICHVPVRRKPLRWRRCRQFGSVVRSCFSPFPSKALFTRSRRFRREIEESVRGETFQLVILNGSDLLWLLEDLPMSIPRIVVAHNIEHQLFESQIRSLHWTPRPLRNLLERDCRRLREMEVRSLRRISNTLFLSREDANRAQRLCEGLNALTVPPLFDYTPREPLESTSTTGLNAAFIGDFGWWPNQTALHWFLDEVFPHTDHDFRLHLFGPQSENAALGHRRVVRHGVFAEFSEVHSRCAFLICPGVSSGGVRVKFAEAVYNRMPVLATSYAARGLPPLDDPAIVLLDTPRQWVEFLGSARSRRLATYRVSARAASAFAVSTHKTAVHQFVHGVLASAKRVAGAASLVGSSLVCTLFGRLAACVCLLAALFIGDAVPV